MIFDHFGKPKEVRSEPQEPLLTDDDLPFLQPSVSKCDGTGWALYDGEKRLEALRFSNGKTQWTVVQEVVNAIRAGTKVIFIRGVCGTGKSAIALHLARELGKASIVVPVKGLQHQYARDYMHGKQIVKSDGTPLHIAMITGRENHESLYFPGKSCADPFLPDTIPLLEKHMSHLIKYYQENPFISQKAIPKLAQLRRISVAPANPYWSPLASAEYELPLSDATKYRYKGLQDKDFIFYHRKKGCSYYDQYLAYIQAEALIFNAAKYKIEVALNRKPATDVDIIDEGDEFLDSFAAQEECNLTRLGTSLGTFFLDDEDASKTRDLLVEYAKLEDQQKRALGVSSEPVKLGDTFLGKMLLLAHEDRALRAELVVDDTHYGHRLYELAEQFFPFFEQTYVQFSLHENDLYVSLVTTSLAEQFRELCEKTKALVFMSGTLHSEQVLKHIFGIRDFLIIDAEVTQPGRIDVQRIGGEFPCSYETFRSGKKDKRAYLTLLNACVTRAPRPTLVHVSAFHDLPTFEEQQLFSLPSLTPKDALQDAQRGDPQNKRIQLFKEGAFPVLFSTKCSRGIDFPGEQCRGIVFTKYPNPNTQDIFWKVLKKNYPDSFASFYQDKAKREFLQRLYRGVRFPGDYVTVLSPDSRVLDAVYKLQRADLNSSSSCVL
jgi:Rad3-related DNA helicase